MNIEPSDETEDSVRIKKAAEVLSEHYDAVHIFALRHESGEKEGTLTWSVGTGSFYSRYGLIRCWLLIKDRETEQEEI